MGINYEDYIQFERDQNESILERLKKVTAIGLFINLRKNKADSNSIVNKIENYLLKFIDIYNKEVINFSKQ